MARSQENGTTILLGLKGYEVGKVIEEEKGIVVEVKTDLKKPACPCYNSRGYIGMGELRRGKCFRGGVKAGGFT